jgi:hypothetical protein
MKPITISDTEKTALMDSFKKYLDELKADDGRISFSTPLVTVTATKPTVYFTTEAYHRMMALVENIDKEIAWHGVVEKIDNQSYLVKDILVYPQKVTGATVTTDDLELGMWYMQLPDETMDNLRFQGHSHVNMPTSPSAVDKNYYADMVQTLHNDDFYIFMIFNKRGDHFAEIYDLAQNILFENNDVTICVVDEAGCSIKDWATETIKNQVKCNETSNTYSSSYTTPYYQEEIDERQNKWESDKDLDWSLRTQDGKVWSTKRRMYVIPTDYKYDSDVKRYVPKEVYDKKYGRTELKILDTITVDGKQYTQNDIEKMSDKDYKKFLAKIGIIDKRTTGGNHHGNGSVQTS